MERLFINETIKKVGEIVKVAGWVHTRRDHGKIVFIDLRDRSGLLQAVLVPGLKDLYETALTLRPEWVVEIEGKISSRPKGSENPEIETGGIELQPDKISVLNESNNPPFSIDGDGYEVNEETRLKYRYLDLRRKRLVRNIVLRDKIIAFIRNYLRPRGFLEIETPILTKSTPEGARDYVVPSRIYPGKFYALPQSPQQYKQLLMVAGFERYFQIARCFRDEDTRGDRQPEFTQFDLEMSFASQEDILNLVEDLFTSLVKEILPEHKITKTPWPRLTYKESMEKYGTDKPDLRENKNDSKELAFGFVVDFPMFEWKETEKRWDAVHHPFTKIKNGRFQVTDDFIDRIKDNPAGLLAHQYDFVLNGYEVGGGSIREHNPKILESVFEIMGNTKKDVRAKFGHLLEAFEYGVPPHGGIAPGIDRLVMLFVGEPNIREVIAFPKTGDARDPMMDSPSEIDEKQLNELGMNLKEDK